MTAFSHPAAFSSALARVQADGTIRVNLRFDVLAYALNDTPARIGEGPVQELVNGPKERLMARLLESKERLTQGIKLVTNTGQIPLRAVSFPSVDDIQEWIKAGNGLPITMEAELEGQLPLQTTSLALRFPQVVGDLVLTIERPGEEDFCQNVGAGIESSSLPISLKQASPRQSTAVVSKSLSDGVVATSLCDVGHASRDIATAEPKGTLSNPRGIAAAYLAGDGLAKSPDMPNVAQRRGYNNAAGACGLIVSFIFMGIRHILPEGADHMLFIAGLVLLNPRLRPLAWQISAFTMAHSITLGLALYGLIRLPSAVVEPLIALSIAFIAIENLFTSKLQPWRVAIVFVFGLVHGLGFASALTDMNLARQHLFTSLVGFNTGVEFGQLTVVLIVLGLLAAFRNRAGYRKAIAIPASSAIALVALFWAIQRLPLHAAQSEPLPMKKILCVTGTAQPWPDFQFLDHHGFKVTTKPENAADLGKAFGNFDIVILACETRNTQHAVIWNYERDLFAYVNKGGKLLFCAPSISAWSMVWSAYPMLLPVTPSMRSSLAENFARKFRWDSEWEHGKQYEAVTREGHPVCAGISNWPKLYEGPKPGSYNAYDFDLWLPKPHTDVALRTKHGGVGLSFMELGSGRTGFLLADIHDDAGKAWEDWGERERFWVALLNHLDHGKLLVQRVPEGVKPFAPRVPLIPRPKCEIPAQAAEGNRDWPSALTRNDWTMMADNQVSLNVSDTPVSKEPEFYCNGWAREPRSELGIGHAKFYPTPTQFDSALSVDAKIGADILELSPVPGAYQWQPHLVVNKFQSKDGNIVVEKRMCIANDVIFAQLRLLKGKVDSLRLRGFNRYYGFLESNAKLLLGQVESGVIFGVSVSEPVHWKTREHPLRYEGEVQFMDSISLAFTAAMERPVVEDRLEHAIRNPEGVFADAFQKWDTYFLQQVPGFKSADPEVEKMYYAAFLGYRLNLYDIPYEPWLDPYSCPSKMHFDPHWEQDDVQSATIAKWLRDTTWIERQLLAGYKLGFMLNMNAAYGHVAQKARGLVGEVQQYAIPMREVYWMNPRPELRDRMVAALLGEENENKSLIPADPKSGLNYNFNCLGMDDSPRWDMVSPGQKAEWYQTFSRGIIAPDFNACIAFREAFLGDLLEDSKDARASEFRTLALQRKQAIRTHLWSSEAGFFVDCVEGESRFSDVLTPMGFTPLLLGAYDTEVTERIGKTLYDQHVFRTPFVLPTVAQSHPKFDALSYWRGSIWQRTNWFAAESFYAAGLKKEAADFTKLWVGLALKDGADLRETNNPLTGEKKCATMFTEGLAGVVDIYLKNIVGFRPTREGFDLDPIALDPQTPSFQFGPVHYRGREVVIAWNREQNRGTVTINGKDEAWEPGVHRSYSFPSEVSRQARKVRQGAE